MTDTAPAPSIRAPDARPSRPPAPDSGAPDIGAVLEELSSDARLVHLRHLLPRDATRQALAAPLPEELAHRLPEGGLWSHQARAIDLVRAGTSVAVATGTASGKSLCYQLPVAEAALHGGTSLLVYPTKALAQDQLQALDHWMPDGAVAATYDGDSTPEERLYVRSNARALLTNPEMLHHGILSNHARWAAFLHDLRVVVVDELHTLRGVFGTHVAQILRRLRRLVLHYGGVEPTFVFTSATVGEPERLASQLCGSPVTAITDDASPRGHRSIALWNPAAEDRSSSDDGRWSVHAEAGLLAARLIRSGMRTLVFCRSRRGTELVAADIRRAVGPDDSDRIRSYRAGYLPAERREIEAELFSGALKGVVATNALELGVDIGGLDAVVLCGYPGTIASFWQQAGRTGRTQAPSLAVLIAGEDQLDQWMMRHPHQLFGRAAEPAVINLDNPHVYVPHLACAAHELPLRLDDATFWPDQLDDGVRRLVIADRGSVRRRPSGRVVVWSGRGTPAPTIGLRSSSRGEYTIRDELGRPIGTVDDARAHQVLHEGAVYLHQGRAWSVLELDPDSMVATVEPSPGDIYTQPRSTTSIRLLGVDDQRRVGASMLHVGAVEVTSQVTSFSTRSTSTHEQLASAPLDLAPSTLETRAVWYVFDDELVAASGVSAEQLPGALHAAEHAAIGILPLFTICDRWDVGGVSTVWLPETTAATVVIHDAHPGGAGVAELAFEAGSRHLSATLDVISACQCTAGCPSCVQSPKCGNGNEPLDKAAAADLLRTTVTTGPRPAR